LGAGQPFVGVEWAALQPCLEGGLEGLDFLERGVNVEKKYADFKNPVQDFKFSVNNSHLSH
jgi:hypothetical protein